MRSTFSLLPYINRSKVRADGTTAVLCRITIDGKQTAISTGIYCRPEDWNGRKNEIKTVRENNRLREYLRLTEEAYTEILKSQGVVSAEMLKNHISLNNIHPTTLLQMGEWERERLKKHSEEIDSTSSYRHSMYYQKYLTDFIASIGKKEIPLEEVTEDFGKSYKAFLKKCKNFSSSQTNKCMCWLNREGMVMQGGKAPSEDAIRYERLVAELASGVKMMELGLPARLANDSLPLVEHWTRELQENPHYIDAIESDVNNALGVIRKAEQGEKVEYATLRTQRQTSEMQERQGPQVDARESAILVDILRTGGMAIDGRNFPSPEARNAFLEKFNLGYYERQKNEALLRVTDEDADVVEIAYTEALAYGAKIATACREYLPTEWNTKGNYRIAEELKSVPDRSTKEMVVVRDRETGIADVVLPAGATTGGHVILSATDRRPFYLTPDEVMPAQERSEQQARVVTNNLPGFSKQQITGALMKQGASYVRFFNKDGLLGYRPDDSYFKDKEVFTAKLTGKELQVQATLDVAEAVDKATNVQFERIQMLRDDNNRWALYLKPVEGEAFSIYPDKEDLNRFFSAVKQNERQSAQGVRMELAQKYYALGTDRPELRQDLFGTASTDVDVSLIKRVNIFRAKDDKFLCVPQIEGMGKIEAREVSRLQWQRIWIAEDMAGYKTQLAATLFADVLKQAQEAKQAKSQVETSEVEHGREKEQVKADGAKGQTDWRNFEELKAKHSDAVLLFRCRDFYESYKEDADRMANVLGLDVSERDGGIHVASFPKTALDTYLPKLVRSGVRVGICDELPRKGVSEMDTPVENEQRPARRM